MHEEPAPAEPYSCPPRISQLIPGRRLLLAGPVEPLVRTCRSRPSRYVRASAGGSGGLVVALGDRLESRTVAGCWHDEDGASARIAPEPIDTHCMLRRCAVLRGALHGHLSPS